LAHEAAVERQMPLAWRLRVVHGLDHSPAATVQLDLEELLR
jgi:hypothetical protein